MTDIPDKWPVAAVLVWIATRDHAAFRIPASKAQSNAPARTIFDLFDKPTFAIGEKGRPYPRAFFDTAPPVPIPLAEHYIRVFRHGTARKLRPAEEVVQAAEELLARLNDGCLSAWRGETEINALTRDYTGDVFKRSCDICFNGADVERGWPAGDKPGLKTGGDENAEPAAEATQHVHEEQAPTPAPEASPTPQIPAVEPVPAKPLDKGHLAIVGFVKAWPLRKGVKDPYLGAWTKALTAAAEALEVTFGRAKQKYGKTATEEIDAARRTAQARSTPKLG